MEKNKNKDNTDMKMSPNKLIDFNTPQSNSIVSHILFTIEEINSLMTEVYEELSEGNYKTGMEKLRESDKLSESLKKDIRGNS